jgi:hypothetical protein
LRQHFIKRPIFAYLKNHALHPERSERKGPDLIEAIIRGKLLGEDSPHLRCGWSKGDNQLASL